MTSSMFARVTAIVLVTVFAAGCANTIRGVGRDTANAVEATQDAGRSVERAAY